MTAKEKADELRDKFYADVINSCLLSLQKKKEGATPPFRQKEKTDALKVNEALHLIGGTKFINRPFLYVPLQTQYYKKGEKFSFGS